MRRRLGRPASLRVGWVAAGTLAGSMTRFRTIPPPVSMRINNNALWLNRHSDAVHNEIYRPDRRYDVVVFVKAMDEVCLAEAHGIKDHGGSVVFDANVNYYEIWGEYDIEDTRPTIEQRQQAIAMTTLADWVVADSSYLLDIVSTVTERASWISDNVDTTLYRLRSAHDAQRPVRLVWSGVAKKARPLLMLLDAFALLSGVELVVVSDGPPDALAQLSTAIPCQFVRYTERRYAKVLRSCDIIISPKRLQNGYELGHTEYKITLGMSVGLPAVASPQHSYVEAISHRGGGVICDSIAEWTDALRSLIGDPAFRNELGALARQTVLERYATPVTAQAYLDVIQSLR